MKIRYTVTTYTKKCPKCGEILESETHGDLTPILAVMSFVLFPVFISYFLLYFLAFSSPDQPKVGPKYCYCPKCFEISKTGNLYKEELYGQDLLNYKFYIVFFLAYGLGAGVLYSLLIGCLDGFSTAVIVVAIICFCVLVGIIITYRILLKKYKKTTASPGRTYALIRKKQNAELQNLSEEVKKIKQKRKPKNTAFGAVEQNIVDYEEWQEGERQGKQSVAKKTQCFNNTRNKDIEVPFSLAYEQRIAEHKKWQEGEQNGKQLVVRDEKITNVNLQGLRLQNSKFLGCTFENLDLSNTRFRRSDLSNSTFIGCNLTQADFTGAKLYNVKFNNCNEGEAVFNQ